MQTGVGRDPSASSRSRFDKKNCSRKAAILFPGRVATRHPSVVCEMIICWCDLSRGYSALNFLIQVLFSKRVEREMRFLLLTPSCALTLLKTDSGVS